MSCCSDKKEAPMDMTISLSTERMSALRFKANRELEEITENYAKIEPAMNFRPSPVKLFPPSRSPNTSISRSRIEANKRKLSEEEYKEINLNFFIMRDDFSTIDFSTVIEGVYYGSDDIFELESRSIYKGEYDIDGEQHGRGIEIKPNGSIYMGYFNHGKIQGIGRLMNNEGILYQGSFVTMDGSTMCDENAVLHGQGKEVWPGGMKYEGGFVMGQKEGQGTLYTKDYQYTGNFHNDEMHGKGIMVWKNKMRYSGAWKRGLMHGKGEFSWPDGKTYIGEYKHGEKHGKGVMKWLNGKMYDGDWKNGQKHGEGVYTYFDKTKNRLRASRSEWAHGNKVRWISPHENAN